MKRETLTTRVKVKICSGGGKEAIYITLFCAASVTIK
jgi:hypothetical protein